MHDFEFEIDEKELLLRATQDSCRDSLIKIHRRHAYFLDQYIHSKVQCTHHASDLIQDIFLKICRSQCKYKGDSKARTFLCGVANIVLKDHFRTEKNKPEVLSLEQAEINGELTVPATASQCPQRIIQKKQSSRIVEIEVEKLPQKARQALKLVYFQGLKPSDAAKKAGCSTETLHNRLYHARKLLRQKLKNMHEKLTL